MFKELSAPITVHWEVTPLCNLNCIHCYNYWRKNKSNTLYAKNSYCESITEEIIRNKIFNVIITGGEPLKVFDDIYLYLKRLTTNGVRLLLNSNLTLLNERFIEKLGELGIDSILTSLPSSKTETYKLITGNRKALLATIKGIKMALKNQINITVNMVISKINLNEIFETAKYLSEIGVTSFAATKAAIPSSGIDFSKFALSIDDYRNMLDELLRINSELKIKVSSLEFYPICSFGNKDRFRSFSTKFCTAGKTACSISFNGQIFPCPHIQLNNYGNIEEGLKKAWKKMSIWRTNCLIPIECSNCNFKNFCMGGCKAESFLKNGSLNSPDPYCDFTFKTYDLKNKKAVKNQLGINEKLLINNNLKTRNETFGGILFLSINRWVAVNKKIYRLATENKGSITSIGEISKYLVIPIEESAKTVNYLLSKSILTVKKGGEIGAYRDN